MNNWISNELEAPYAGTLVWVKWHGIVTNKEEKIWLGRRDVHSGDTSWKVVNPKNFRDTNCLPDECVTEWMFVSVPLGV